MSELAGIVNLARDADVLVCLVALGWALYTRRLRFGNDCDAREAALLEQIKELQADAKEDAAEARARDERHERVFEEFRRRFWEQGR